MTSLALLGGVGCRSQPAAPPGRDGGGAPSPAARPAAAPGVAGAAAPRDAGRPADATAALDAGAADGGAGPGNTLALLPGEVDLLASVPSVVAVSSVVKNASDRPEHLVDGKLETAWNSRSGDLRGWMAFRVPSDVRVTRIALTVGYDRVNAEGDLFVMNHRIRRVKVRTAHVPVGEFTLDPVRRGLQIISVGDRSGGDYRIEVLETVPGSKPKWRELCVSELRVLGRLPAGRAAPAAPLRPVVRVGALDEQPAVLVKHCQQHMETELETYRKEKDPEKNPHASEPSCATVPSQVLQLSPPYRAAMIFSSETTRSSERNLGVQGPGADDFHVVELTSSANKSDPEDAHKITVSGFDLKEVGEPGSRQLRVSYEETHDRFIWPNPEADEVGNRRESETKECELLCALTPGSPTCGKASCKVRKD